MHTNRHDEEITALARTMRAEGATYKQIMATLRVGSDTVSKMLGTQGSRGGRPRVPTETREKARALRRAGKTVPEIGQELGLARSTAWQITKDIPWTPAHDTSSRQKDAARRRWERYDERRARDRKVARDATMVEVGELTDRELMLIGAVLYWAEGSKAKPWRPNDERLRFINSDPDVVRVYLTWLDLLGVSRDRVTARLSIHESADVAAANIYWAEVVGIPVESMARATLKRHNPKTVRKNTDDSYHGCVVIDVAASAGEYWRMHGVWSGIAQYIGGVVRKRRATDMAS